MDVDRSKGKPRSIRCYNCGKFGHMSRNCPDPPQRKFSVRALWAQIDDAEKGEGGFLNELVKKLREKGF